LWELSLDSAVEGVPATYEIAGRQYLVICAAAQNGTLPIGTVTQPPPGPGRYIVLALPDSSGDGED
jgi:quinoprotein glucose dehydrogenase